MAGTDGKRSEHRPPPRYDRQAWLADSIRATDLVVIGFPQLQYDQPRLLILRALYGSVPEEVWLGKQVVPIVPTRFGQGGEAHQGVWILIRTPAGYYSTNPSIGPLDEHEWKHQASRLRTNVYASGPELEVHASGTQLYRTFSRDGKDHWHGVNTFSYSEVFEELHEQGRKVHVRAWDAKGRLERVGKIPEKGYGFIVQWHKGTLLEFAHYLDGKKTGLAREYRRGTDRLRRETHWKAGVRHGLDRTFDEQGELESETRYEDGFIPPVIRYRGKAAGEATLTKGEDRLYYHAPRDVMAEFIERGVGMTTAQVSALLRLDFSEKSGITFWHFRCDTALVVEFDRGKVSSVRTLPNGAHCKMVE